MSASLVDHSIQNPCLGLCLCVGKRTCDASWARWGHISNVSLSLAPALPADARLSAPGTNPRPAQGGARAKKSSPLGTVSAAFFLFCPVIVWPQPMEPPRAQCHAPVKALRPLPQMSSTQPLCSQSCRPGFHSLMKDWVPLQPRHPQSAKATLCSGPATPQ